MSPDTPRLIPKYNPATGDLIRQYPAADADKVKDTVAQARACQAVWSETSLKKRAAVLKSAATLLYEQRLAIARLISEETGKPWPDSLEADLGPALSALTYYASLGPKCLKPRWLQPDPISLITLRSHRKIYHPRGVIAVISPWNYPVGIPMGGLAAALMAGNTVVLKPSEHSPACGLKIVEILQTALKAHHLPSDIVQCFLGDGETGAQLLEQTIDGVIFTGSEPVGRRIQRRAAERNLWCSLELGGSDAMILLEDADSGHASNDKALEIAASYAVWGRFANSGQACAAVKRVYVPANQEAALLDLLQAKICQLTIGPPQDPPSHLGPLISEAQREQVDSQVQDALRQGAICLMGGQKTSGQGWFYEPTLLTQVPPAARVLTEEVFGPVLPVIPYGSVDEVIASVNQSAFGLTASLMGQPEQAKAIAARLQCGTVVINDAGTSNFAMLCAPWGGWKSSGPGSSHGEQALLDLCRVQIVSTNGMRGIPFMEKPLWQFAQASKGWQARSQTVLSFCARHPTALNPLNWLSFWRHRASTKL